MTSLRDKMHSEQRLKDLYKQSQGYAFEYADGVAERSPFPSVEALAGLDSFVEDMPSENGDPR